MNENENKLISHGGLTYGGFITNERMKQHIMNECFDELLKYGKENGYKEIKYKTTKYTIDTLSWEANINLQHLADTSHKHRILIGTMIP